MVEDFLLASNFLNSQVLLYIQQHLVHSYVFKLSTIENNVVLMRQWKLYWYKTEFIPK